MAISDAVNLGLEITRGVVALHSAGIVHRDLKPENILLPASGTPRAKIADLGIARFWEKRRSTQTSEWRGTPMYGAPETFTSSTTTDGSKVAPLTPEADIYSLGVLLFRMLTGEFVFPVRDEGDTYEVVAAHLHGHPRRARTLNVDVPADLEQLLVQMVTRRPSDRPTLRHVQEVLERHTSGEARGRASAVPFSAPPSLGIAPGLPPELDQGTWPRLTPVQRQAAAIVVGAVLLLTAALLLRSGPAPTTRVLTTDDAAVHNNPPHVASAALEPANAGATPYAATSAPRGADTSPQTFPAAMSKARAGAPAGSDPAPTSGVTIEVQADGVVLANDRATTVPSVELVAIAADGSRYQFSSADAMESRSQMMVPFAMFQPEVPRDTHLRRVDILIGAGRRSQDRLSRHLD